MARMVEAELLGNLLSFETAPSLFSPRGIDEGARAMLDALSLGDDELVLDLGCGYGVVGIAIARVIGADRVTMVVVVKRLLWYRKKLQSVFGGVNATTQGEYHVLESVKRSEQRPTRPKSTPSRKHERRIQRAAGRKRRR